MKKSIASLFIALLLGSLSINAQDLKKVKTKSKSKGYKEIYFVLKSDKTVKHGAYTQTDLNGNILKTGFYKNNVKDSLWNIYIPGTNLVKSQGYYKDGYKDINWVNFGFDHNNIYRLISFGNYDKGEKTGVWEYKNSRNQTFFKTNYSENKILNSELNSTNVEYYVNNMPQTANTDHPAFYDGGLEICNKSVRISSKMPLLKSADGASVNENVVIISFIIDENGVASEHTIEKSVGVCCDEKAFNAVKAIPDRWVPARVNGKFVESKFILPVTVKVD